MRLENGPAAASSGAAKQKSPDAGRAGGGSRLLGGTNGSAGAAPAQPAQCAHWLQV